MAEAAASAEAVWAQGNLLLVIFPFLMKKRRNFICVVLFFSEIRLFLQERKYNFRISYCNLIFYIL